ncbi:MAG TPA: isochorismatase family cysteine hydrolase [Ktedonobacterales bacterium]|jgi:nicotinamidase-related amidase
MEMPQSTTIAGALIEQSRLFLEWLVEWERSLPVLRWADLTRETPPERIGIFCIDMTNGFCHEGNLASPRIHALIPAVRRLFEDAHHGGVRQFVLPQDTHRQDALEFHDFPLHCVAGTIEAETVAELQELPFADLFRVFPKNSISTSQDTGLDGWLDAHADLGAALICGDCTDLCVHQLTMHLKLRANARDQSLRVIVPANCVQTYDLPVAAAQQLGALPHDGDLLHLIFLYHLRLNGAEVVREIV